MMDTLQLIAAYWRGDLKGEVLQQFEERLQSDATFAEEVADYQRVETIGKYLNHELKGAELEAFEAQLVVDKDLAAELMEYADESIYEDLTTYLQLLGEQVELEKTFKELSEAYKKDLEGESLKVSHKATSTSTPKSTNTTLPKSISETSRRLWIVAAIAAVLAIAFFISPFFKQPSLEVLYASNIEVDKKASFSTKGNAEDVLSKGAQAFNQGKYTVAIEAFESYLSTHQDDNEVKRYTGIAYLELKQPDKEIERDSFDKAIRLFEALGEADKNWYLALAYLKQGNTEKTKEYLLQIATHNIHYSKAKKILSQL
ncbi:MAG: hypothetical protein R3E32_27880 [Chitinophagales bacterium]